MNDFETKIAAAGDLFQKLAAERGLTMDDFTEEEATEFLTTIMGKTASEVEQELKVAAAAAPAPAAPAAPAPTKVASVSYGTAMAEVIKLAQANNVDISKSTPAEIDDAVVKMASLMSDPAYTEKQAALQEKVAESDMMGRVMARSFADELGKISENAKTAQKADLLKVAGEMPEAFKKHLAGKGKGDDKDDKGEDKKDEDKDDKEKEAQLKLASEVRAAELLLASGVHPFTGQKIASVEDNVEARAQLLLLQRGWL